MEPIASQCKVSDLAGSAAYESCIRGALGLRFFVGRGRGEGGPSVSKSNLAAGVIPSANRGDWNRHNEQICGALVVTILDQVAEPSIAGRPGGGTTRRGMALAPRAVTVTALASQYCHMDIVSLRRGNLEGSCSSRLQYHQHYLVHKRYNVPLMLLEHGKTTPISPTR